MAIIAKPDPASVEGATFAHTGPERVVEAIKRWLTEAGGPVSEDVLVTEFGPRVHYTDAARAWMDQYRYRLPRAIKRNPELADIDPERAFSVGAGRPSWETQSARYDDGQRIVIVNYILGRLAAFERVTAMGQPYPDARGRRLGTVYWRLAAPKPKRLPRPRRPRPVPLPAASSAGQHDIGGITARIKSLQRAPLEQGRLLLQVKDDLLFLPDYPDFPAYVKANFSFGLRRANQLIGMARVKNTFMSSGTIVPGKKFVVPENEGQARLLVPLLDRPDDLRRAWQIVVDTARVDESDGSPEITARHIKEVLQRLGLATAGPASPAPVAGAGTPLDDLLEALAAGDYDDDLEALRTALDARVRTLRGEEGMPCLTP